MWGVSSPSSSGSRYTAEVTILVVNSNQAKTTLAGAIFQGLSLWFLLAQPLHYLYLLALFSPWNSVNLPGNSLSPQDVVPLLSLQPSKHGSNELGASLWP